MGIKGPENGPIQGFPQMLRTWGGALQNFMGGGGGEHESKHGGCMGRLKTLLKNTCEGVHLFVKLLAVRLQACKFTKNELLHTYFSGILARF